MSLSVVNFITSIYFIQISSVPSACASWEYNADFDTNIRNHQRQSSRDSHFSQKWVDWRGDRIRPSEEATASHIKADSVTRVLDGRQLADLSELRFRDPNCFSAGELHNHADQWQAMAGDTPSPRQAEVLKWVLQKVSVFEYFRPFNGVFKGKSYNSDRPPSEYFKNNFSCKQFADFVRKTILERLTTGAVSLLGKVGQVDPPHLILPLTVEPSKPRLCHDARFLNLWMVDMPFSLDTLTNLPRYVTPGSFQTILDDKSGYDHLLLNEESRTFFGIQWGGWYFVYNTLPFGWKISPYIYHSTGLMASDYFRSVGIPCSLYIDDRHNGQLQIASNKGVYQSLLKPEVRNFEAAKAAIFVIAYYLVLLGYFFNLKKSILIPQQVVPYLGFLSDSLRQAFLLLPEKKEKLLSLVRSLLSLTRIQTKSLQRLAGKCISLSISVPAALLFTREMHRAITKALRTGKPISMYQALEMEIRHWLFLEAWDDPLPWREEKHLSLKLASDASGSGWGGVLLSSPELSTSDYWTTEEQKCDIATKEAVALNKVLLSFAPRLRNTWVDANVDNQAVVHAWQSQGGRSKSLNDAMKDLFFTTLELNIALHLVYIPTIENPADAPSRRLSSRDACLHPTMWATVQRHFGGELGHTCDLMALDSNAMPDLQGRPLPHFTPYPSPGSQGVNLFAQDLSSVYPFLEVPYVFPPLILVGPVLRFLAKRIRSCTLVTLDVYPKKYWWPIIQKYSVHAVKLALMGDTNALLVPSRGGWTAHSGIPGDLWAFALRFE